VWKGGKSSILRANGNKKDSKHMVKSSRKLNKIKGESKKGKTITIWSGKLVEQSGLQESGGSC